MSVSLALGMTVGRRSAQRMCHPPLVIPHVCHSEVHRGIWGVEGRRVDSSLALGMTVSRRSERQFIGAVREPPLRSTAKCGLYALRN